MVFRTSSGGFYDSYEPISECKRTDLHVIANGILFREMLGVVPKE